MTSCHLIANSDLLLLCDKHTDILDSSLVNWVTVFDRFYFSISIVIEILELTFVTFYNLENFYSNRRWWNIDISMHRRQASQQSLSYFTVRRNNYISCFRILYIKRNFFAEQNIGKGFC